MVYYQIIKINDNYYVVKNVESKHAIGSKAHFSGTQTECEKYCKDHNIKLGKKNKKNIKKM